MIGRLTSKNKPHKKVINTKYSGHRNFLKARRILFSRLLTSSYKFDLDLSIVLQERDLPEFVPSSVILPDSLFEEEQEIANSDWGAFSRLDPDSEEFQAITTARRVVLL